MDIFGNFSKLTGDKNKRRIRDKEEMDFSYSETTIKGISRLEQNESITNIQLIRFCLVAVFMVLIWRVFSLQVVQGNFHQKLAEGNRTRPRVIEASRGLIMDNKGVWLARNKPDFALAFYPSDLPRQLIEQEKILQQVATAASLPLDEVRQKASQKGNYFLEAVILKDHLSHEEALILEEKIFGIPGVFVAHRSSREYAQIGGLSHLLGYTGPLSSDDIKSHSDYFLSDWIGKAGSEKVYEEYLKGRHGVEQVEVDSRGEVVRILASEENRQPLSGHDIVLYLDRDLQIKTAEALKNGLLKAKELTGREVESGAAIVMDVKTGGILSMVSLPDYDNNLFSTRIKAEDYQRLVDDENQPLFNRAIGGMYPPGSIIKIIMAAAGLVEGAISESTALDTPPAINIGSWSFPDWKDHGLTNIRRAIAESNNIFFYAIGGGYDKIPGIGIGKIKKYWQLFGLGEETGIDLPGEEVGLLPDAEWKQKVKNEPWYIGDTYHVSIGQGDLLVTPLQMVRVVVAIANGGKLLEPHLVKKITDSNGEVTKEFGPQVVRENFLPPQTIQVVQEGMRLTVTEGSARALNDLPVPVAGKTGTAQFFNNEKTHAWFEAFAPYKDPEIAVIVLIEGGGGGNETAAPVAKEILSQYFNR